MPPAITRSAAWAWRCADTAVRFAIIQSMFWSALFLPRYGAHSSASAKRLTFIDSTKAHGSPPQLLASGQPREALTPGSRVEPASGREQPAQAVALVPS